MRAYRHGSMGIFRARPRPSAPAAVPLEDLPEGVEVYHGLNCRAALWADCLVLHFHGDIANPAQIAASPREIPLGAVAGYTVQNQHGRLNFLCIDLRGHLATGPGLGSLDVVLLDPAVSSDEFETALMDRVEENEPIEDFEPARRRRATRKPSADSPLLDWLQG